jgi:hypothetical protein
MLLILTLIPVTNAQVEFNLQVGATADDGSLGNIGIRADIRTNSYNVSKPDLADAFWVGNNLENGSFIQFGYILQPGSYCLAGKVQGEHVDCRTKYQQIGESDARWFWEYWPNASNPIFYFGTGGNNSAGTQGSWHNYEIEPSPQNGWTFILDSRQVANFSAHYAPSKDPAYMVAEKVTLSIAPGNLGPVEFRNLAYLKQDGWHNSTALYALVGCGVNPVCITNPYGVSLESADQIIAGSGLSQPQDRDLLWSISQQEQTSSPNYTMNGIYGAGVLLFLIAVLVVVVVVTGRKRMSPSPIQTTNQFCMVCGAPFEPDTQFCTNCGAKRS